MHAARRFLLVSVASAATCFSACAKEKVENIETFGSSKPDLAACDAPAKIVRDGPCKATGVECSTDGTCGSCKADERCVDGRCFLELGVPLDTPYDLSRGFRDDGEGFECFVEEDVVLERIDGMLAAKNLPAIAAQVFAQCGEGGVDPVEVTEQRVNAAAISHVLNDNEPVAFVLDHPVLLRAPSRVRVAWHVDVHYPVFVDDEQVATEAVVMHDIEPNCRATTAKNSPYGYLLNPDQLALLYLHRLN